MPESGPLKHDTTNERLDGTSVKKSLTIIDSILKIIIIIKVIKRRFGY